MRHAIWALDSVQVEEELEPYEEVAVQLLCAKKA